MKRTIGLSIVAFYLVSFMVGCAGRNQQPQFDIAESQLAQPEQSAEVQQVAFEQPLNSVTGETKWHESYEAAQRESLSTGKPILAGFTGSDWCPPCIKLKKVVFESPEFKTWAAENVVLLELDFPKTTPQPQSTRVQNQQLAQKYGIDAYPTVVFLADNGKQLGKMGFASNPDQWIAGAEAQLR